MKGTSKRKRYTPSPQANVKTKRMIFEDKLAKKYQAQRCAKELAREKNKLKKEKAKKENSEEETSIAQLLKEMREDIRKIKTDNEEIKSDNKEIKQSIGQMNNKIKAFEDKQSTTEERTSAAILEIRNEMKTSNSELEKKLMDMKKHNEICEKNRTDKVVETLKPKIRDIEVNSKCDLRNLIREELALQHDAETDGEA